MLSAEYIHKHNGISSVLKPSNKKKKNAHAWEDTDWITSASWLLRCVENADTRRLGRNRRKACAVPPLTTQAYKTALWPVVHVTDGRNSTSGEATFIILSLSGQTEKTHFLVFQGNTPKWCVSFWLHGGDSATHILPGNYLISVCLSHSSFLSFFSAFIHLV